MRLNIVTGWNKPEYTQMGLWRGDEYYERRYEYAAEYLQILQELWRTGNAPTRVSSSILRNAVACPHPGGHSDRQRRYVTEGVEFVAQHAHQNFVMAHPEKLKDISDSVKAKGCHRKRGWHLRAVQHYHRRN